MQLDARGGDGMEERIGIHNGAALVVECTNQKLDAQLAG